MAANPALVDCLGHSFYYLAVVPHHPLVKKATTRHAVDIRLGAAAVHKMLNDLPARTKPDAKLADRLKDVNARLPGSLLEWNLRWGTHREKENDALATDSLRIGRADFLRVSTLR